MAADLTIQKRSIDTIRALAMDAVQKANAGHPGTAMALAPLAYVLYRRVLRHNPANPDWANRDRFILSAGHACILQYATLHLTGYNLSLEELKRFRQWESSTPGHPEHFVTEGVETTTGPLGQGFANGVGFAIADRFLAERYNRPHHEIVDRFVYAICSDGDLMEGLSYEAGVDRRPPRPRPARLLLRRQPHHDRRHHRRSRSRPRTRRSASRRRAGTCSRSPTRRTSTRSSARRGRRRPSRTRRR